MTQGTGERGRERGTLQDFDPGTFLILRLHPLFLGGHVQLRQLVFLYSERHGNPVLPDLAHCAVRHRRVAKQSRKLFAGVRRIHCVAAHASPTRTRLRWSGSQ